MIVFAASASFFFGHRVWFFVQSTMRGDALGQDQEQIYRKCRLLLKALKSVCLENKKEKLYLANSKDLNALIIELGLIEHWPCLR